MHLNKEKNRAYLVVAAGVLFLVVFCVFLWRNAESLASSGLFPEPVGGNIVSGLIYKQTIDGHEYLTKSGGRYDSGLLVHSEGCPCRTK